MSDHDLQIIMRTALEGQAMETAKRNLNDLKGSTEQASSASDGFNVNQRKVATTMVGLNNALQHGEVNMRGLVRIMASMGGALGGIAGPLALLAAAFMTSWQAGKKLGDYLWDKLVPGFSEQGLSGSIRKANEQLAALDAAKFDNLKKSLEDIKTASDQVAAKFKALSDFEESVFAARENLDIAKIKATTAPGPERDLAIEQVKTKYAGEKTSRQISRLGQELTDKETLGSQYQTSYDQLLGERDTARSELERDLALMETRRISKQQPEAPSRREDVVNPLLHPLKFHLQNSRMLGRAAGSLFDYATGLDAEGVGDMPGAPSAELLKRARLAQSRLSRAEGALGTVGKDLQGKVAGISAEKMTLSGQLEAARISQQTIPIESQAAQQDAAETAAIAEEKQRLADEKDVEEYAKRRIQKEAQDEERAAEAQRKLGQSQVTGLRRAASSFQGRSQSLHREALEERANTLADQIDQTFEVSNNARLERLNRKLEEFNDKIRMAPSGE